jgi:DDE superfamily endonuclease
VHWDCRDKRRGRPTRTPLRGPAWRGKKKQLPAALARVASAHPGKRIALYFQDEARFGQKGRSCRRWWLRGERPTGPIDQRYTFAYVFAAVEPMTGRDFCLVLPVVSAAAMSEFLRRFSATLPEDEHAVMVLDGAGWHTSDQLVVPDNVTLLRLPPPLPFHALRAWNLWQLRPTRRNSTRSNGSGCIYANDTSRTECMRDTPRSSMPSARHGAG